MIDDDEGLRSILADSRVIAVVGLSVRGYRPSYGVAQYLMRQNYIVIPVNPKYSGVLGQKCYPSLLDVPMKVDIVDCFRKQEEIPAIADDAIKIGAKVLWMQQGIYNEEAVSKAEAAGLRVVANRCIRVEHSRLLAPTS